MNIILNIILVVAVWVMAILMWIDIFKDRKNRKNSEEQDLAEFKSLVIPSLKIWLQQLTEGICESREWNELKIRHMWVAEVLGNRYLGKQFIKELDEIDKQFDGRYKEAPYQVDDIIKDKAKKVLGKINRLR